LEIARIDPPYPVDGRLTIPEKPGLGLSINEDGLVATRLE
jgi:L-alanine-DL-glutamate epimerase-like enolase superfamily enzyme